MIMKSHLQKHGFQDSFLTLSDGTANAQHFFSSGSGNVYLNDYFIYYWEEISVYEYSYI